MKKTLLLVACGFAAHSLLAQQFVLEASNETKTTFRHELQEHAIEVLPLNGKAHIQFSKTFDITTKEVGAPELPTFSESVILPNTGNYTLIVTHSDYEEWNNVNVLPSKGSLKRNVNPSSVPFAFGEHYQTDAFYPGNLAEAGSPYVLRNARGVTVTFYPYQYNPVTKKLRVYHTISVQVVANPSEAGENELSVSNNDNVAFMKVYENHFINGDQYTNKYSPLEEEGEMLIITDPAYTETLAPFVDWKTRKGIKTTVVTTDDAGSTDTEIKAYISSFYSGNPNLMYVLLAGDHQQVPSHTYGTSGWEELWSDSYYGQLVGASNDYYPEVFIGRFSAASATQLEVMINRTLEYEKSASGDWMTKAIGLASDEGAGYGDDGEADWQHARNIRTKLLNFGYTEVYEFYDGSHGGADASGSPSAATILTAVNDGIGYFNYTGHGDQNSCVTGNFGSTQVNQGTNNNMYPFVVSVACNNGTFTSGTCLSEVWQRATNAGDPSGAIAACGSSILMAWAEPMQTQDELAEILTEAYTSNRKETIGGLFYNGQMSMLEEYNSSTTAREVMQTWIFFGDPSTVFRTKVSTPLTASHLANVPLGTSNVVVDCNVEGATVALVQNGIILGKGTVSGGEVNFNFTALTSDSPLYVTATKQNYNAYEGFIQVGNGPLGMDEQVLSDVSVYPNPADDAVMIEWTASEAGTITLTDVSGKVVWSAETTTTGSGQLKVDVNALNAGVYFLKLEEGESRYIQKVIIR